MGNRNKLNTIGWREWVSLPDLGIPAIKAKIDTGAKTSALHTFKIDEFNRDGNNYVRFDIHPVQKRTDIIVSCESLIIDKRNVRDSGGHEEERYVIKSAIEIGRIVESIEITLTSRDDMIFRMLLGRSALDIDDLYVDPNNSYLMSDRVKHHASLYKGLKI